jgi:hypothetical protein
MGFHSVIDKPECVSLVTPPTTTMAHTNAQQIRSHTAIERRALVGEARASSASEPIVRVEGCDAMARILPYECIRFGRDGGVSWS